MSFKQVFIILILCLVAIPLFLIADGTKEIESITASGNFVLSARRPNVHPVIKVDPENGKDCALIKTKWIKLAAVEEISKWKELTKGKSVWARIDVTEAINCDV